jgi:hypothetical protein
MTDGLTVSKRRKAELTSSLIAMMAQGYSLRESSLALEIPLTTASRWSREPAAIAARERLTRRANERTRTILATKSADAVLRLSLLTHSGDEVVATRSSESLIRLALKAAEDGDGAKISAALVSDWIGQVFTVLEKHFGDQRETLLAVYDDLQHIHSTNGEIEASEWMQHVDIEPLRGDETIDAEAIDLTDHLPADNQNAGDESDD